MLSLLFLLFAVVHLGIWFWGWKLWSTTGRPVSLFLVLFGGTLLFYDNLRIGIGRFIGEGELLYALSQPAFAWHWSMLPLLVIAAGSVARQAGLGWAQNKFVMGAFCVVAVALSIHDIPKIFSMQLYPACLADTVRYSTAVSEAQVCPGGVVVPRTAGAEAALVAIVTNIIVLGVGIALWVKRRWPWMAAGSGAMFVAAAAGGMHPMALPIANFGEICITLGMIVTCAHFARLAQKAPPAAPQAAVRPAA